MIDGTPERAPLALEGDVLDILVQARRDCRAATRFFRTLLQEQARQPGRSVMPSVAQRTDRYEHNRAEVSHQPTRQRARQMRRVNSPGAGTTILVRAWTRAESLPGRATSPAVGAPPLAPKAGVRRMRCGDVCLLNDEGYRAIERSSRPPLINLTVPNY